MTASTPKENGDDTVSQMLIEAGADTNFINFTRSHEHENGPPLREALLGRNAHLVSLLLNADASPNYCESNPTCTYKDSAMLLAVEWGNHTVIQQLIEAGARLNCSCGRDSSRHSLPLTNATKKSDLDLVKFLLDAGVEVNHPEARWRGGTALAAAASNGDIEMTRYLLSHGADPYDLEAFDASFKIKGELFEALLKSHKARYPQGHKEVDAWLLGQAVETGDYDYFARLINEKHDATAICEGVSPFEQAIFKAALGDSRFVEKLLKEGCSPRAFVVPRDQSLGLSSPLPRITAFLAAIATGNASVVELFIRSDADVNFPTRLGIKRTPLQQASEDGHLDIVQLLIKSGADVHAAASERGGGTALQLAAIGGYNTIVNLLIQYGADVDAPASKVHGRMALEGAAEHGRLDTVALLLEAGAACGGNGHAMLERAISLANDGGF